MKHPRAAGSRRAIGLALLSAALFGLSTPAAKRLVAVSDPWLLAGLLYLGSGLGLGAYRLLSRFLAGPGACPARLRSQDWLWLGGAILSGGCIAPVLLMLALRAGTASATSLLLNLEGLFTALLAWSVFREHYDRRIVLGMIAIGAGAAVLSGKGEDGQGLNVPALAAAGACLAWALDNNLTRKVSAADPVQIAALKGMIAGMVNLTIGLGLGASLPTTATMLGASVVGLLGYGLSLVLFVLALRELGAGRTGAYFSTGPFLGAVASVIALGEPLTPQLGIAAALMGLGVWLHASEHHEHEHEHEALGHEHAHRHDEHHRHDHPPGTPSGETHSHWHAHAPLRHRHPHFPDIHHRHHH
jgi:drug/metabolite transporter (DMT)-like permease